MDPPPSSSGETSSTDLPTNNKTTSTPNRLRDEARILSLVLPLDLLFADHNMLLSSLISRQSTSHYHNKSNINISQQRTRPTTELNSFRKWDLAYLSTRPLHYCRSADIAASTPSSSSKTLLNLSQLLLLPNNHKNLHLLISKNISQIYPLSPHSPQRYYCSKPTTTQDNKNKNNKDKDKNNREENNEQKDKNNSNNNNQSNQQEGASTSGASSGKKSLFASPPWLENLMMAIFLLLSVPAIGIFLLIRPKGGN